MKLLREHKVRSSFLDEEKQIFKDVWHPASGDLSVSEFQNEVQIQADLMKESGASRILIDATNFHYSIVPEVQDWIVDNIFTQWTAMGIKKIAMMVSSEMISQLSIEQTFEEEKSDVFRTFYFDNEAKAVNWLLDIYWVERI